MTVARLLQWCRESSSGSPDGITISGGEPFDQPGALAAFLDGLLDWRTSAGLDFDILCYSGYPLSTLRRKHAALLGRLDAVLAEPYIDSQPTLKPWRGSDNQRLELLTERARAHFAAPLAQSTASLDKRIQVFVDSQRVWYVGIPARGDLAALEQACGENGVDFSQVSWRQ